MTILCEILFVIAVLAAAVFLIGVFVYSVIWAITVNKGAVRRLKRMKNE